jgi:excisionase family DNA binding protein
MVDIYTTQRKNLRVDEVMEIFNVSRRTVYYWIEKRRIAAVNIGGGRFAIPVADLRRRADESYTGPERRRSHLVQSATIQPDSL